MVYKPKDMMQSAQAQQVEVLKASTVDHLAASADSTVKKYEAIIN